MTAGGGRRHVLDRSVRRSAGGRLLVGGTPGRLIRLSAAGAAALDALLAGEAVDAAALALGRRLCQAGLLHPLPGRRPPAPVTFVIPVRDGGGDLGTLVARLREWGEVVVADDGSRDGSSQLARANGARVIANPGPRGPAAARNAGLRAARTDLVAFVDADCRCPGEWTTALASLLADDPRLALVAPRVRSAAGDSAIAAYETAFSPLDQGQLPSLVGPGHRVGFVPAAALLARRDALLALGGFAEEMRVGEDVDLVWRLLEAGWTVRYVPQVEVLHRPRSSLRGLAAQRFGYGTSAADLDARHPGAPSPLRVGDHDLAIAAAGVSRGPIAGVAAALTSITLTSSRGTGREARLALAELALRARAANAAQLSRAVVRDWLPLAAIACALSPRARRAVGLALAVDLLASARRDATPPRTPLRLALRLFDVASYSAGLWTGIVRRRRLSAALPRRARQPRRASEGAALAAVPCPPPPKGPRKRAPSDPG